jgi:(S)-3,5-dihydroxyphenylglycine transaminase
VKETITKIDFKSLMQGTLLESMNYLNNISEQFPSAISFASGRPPNSFLDVHRSGEWIDNYITFVSEKTAKTKEDVWKTLGQYAATKGIINTLLSSFLQEIEGVDYPVDNLIITNGFQEALCIELRKLALVNGALLVIDPTYIGLSGAAMINEVPIYTFTVEGNLSKKIEAAAAIALNDGYENLALYVIPDFDNPTGTCLNLQQRKDIIKICQTHNILILEDVAYRYFYFEAQPNPSMFALDNNGIVIQLGTFAKSFMPGVRLGYNIKKKKSVINWALPTGFSTTIKSYISVTTSPLNQAILGGFLLEGSKSFKDLNQDRNNFCKENRDALLAVLNEELGDLNNVSWTLPEGGFFLIVSLPFEFTEKESFEMANTFNVIVSPLKMFSLRGSFENCVRLAYSNVEVEEAIEGAKRFSNYVKSKLT